MVFAYQNFENEPRAISNEMNTITHINNENNKIHHENVFAPNMRATLLFMSFYLGR